ncbi:heavy-metal-associated domain-containing protein, partial [Streptomyces asiaticus]
MAAESASRTVVTDLSVGGMTCAACVRRVEKKLARLDGVTATVNLATGRARVLAPYTFPELLGLLAQVPVSQLLQREDFRNRL